MVHQKATEMSDSSGHLPYLTRDFQGIGGRLKTSPEDFVVEEIPAYLPSGNGEHLYLKFRKRGLDTKVAIHRLADALGADVREAGWAGLKDRHAETTQWASFARVPEDRVTGVDLEGIEVLETSRHGNKLRTGHLRANRFDILVRGASDVVQARATLAVLEGRGCPNYYGDQRFGRDNLARALAWARGGRAPKGRFQRKLLASVLQSAGFNEVCRDRVAAGTVDKALPGDVFRKEDSGGLFTTGDLDDAARRVATNEISPTGPMPGPKMRRAVGEVERLEAVALERVGLDPDGIDRLARFAPGTRRSLRVFPTDATASVTADGLRVTFTLRSGAYATSVMRELMKTETTPARVACSD